MTRRRRTTKLRRQTEATRQQRRRTEGNTRRRTGTFRMEQGFVPRANCGASRWTRSTRSSSACRPPRWPAAAASARPYRHGRLPPRPPSTSAIAPATPCRSSSTVPTTRPTPTSAAPTRACSRSRAPATASSSYHTRLYACNPSTRRWRRLPPLHDDHVIVGFYGHGAIDEREYRVLYHTTRPGCRYWVFSLSFFPDQPPRDIGRPADLEAVRDVLAEGISPSYEMPPVAVAHRLHWRAQADSRNVLVFDTIAESFGWIPPPNQQEGN
uniref:Uncharacterized protein n=1 Tax=Oryza barthii TaxID=65489 RepID=A0A0D3F656_9ORYZ